MFGMATPVLRWPTVLLPQIGWSVVGVTRDEDRLSREGASHVGRGADSALDQAPHDQPVLVVAKSLGTLALPGAAITCLSSMINSCSELKPKSAT
jgi:hypothetical protein